ncbi:MAG: hypothetical protein SPL21_05155 [Fibrobacter sp.]|nr:hypothetical protein [Fibrobacter sp.]
MLDELSSDGDDSSGLILDELISDEEDSAGFVSLLLDSTGLSELDDLSSIFELEDSSVFTELDDPSVFAELEDSTFRELDDFSSLPLLLDSTFPELDEAFPSLEELPPTAFSLDEDPSDSTDCGACPELVEGLSVTLDDEPLPETTSSLEEERVTSLSAGPAGESLEPSSPQALPSNAATTTIPPRTNFFSIKNLTPKYNPKPPQNQPPRDQKHRFLPHTARLIACFPTKKSVYLSMELLCHTTS